MRLLRRNLALELDIHCFRMADEHRHAHAGRGQFDLGVEDLLGLDHHLPLFLGRPVVEEAVDMRNHIERDLLGKLACLGTVADEDVARLLEQLVHAFFACARYRLISRNDDALDLGIVMQRLERDDQLRGRAVRIGDDIALHIAGDRLRVHLWHDQRHIGVHAIERRIVDHRAARSGKARRVDLCPFRSDGEQRHIPTGGIEIVDVLDLEHLAAVTQLDFGALTARRRNGRDLVDRELPLGKDVEHLAPDIARRAHDHDPVTHDKLRSFRLSAPHSR